jgi:hypothetical protein
LILTSTTRNAKKLMNARMMIAPAVSIRVRLTGIEGRLTLLSTMDTAHHDVNPRGQT